MPKPNRYMGNGQPYPEGTRMGRYVMRKGHWVDFQSPLGQAPVKPSAADYKATMRLAIWAGVVCLATVVTALVVAASH